MDPEWKEGPVGTRFGDKLRKARTEAQMTQAQLGDGRYSTSYISLLETGAHEPTIDIINELSSRLGIDRDVMEGWNTPVSPDDAEFVLLEHRARQSFTARDYADAEDTARRAAEIARATKNSGAWWNMAFLRAEALRELGRTEEFLKVAQEILAHPLTEESGALVVRAETLVSTALLAVGRLHVAVEHALKAVNGSKDELPDASLIALSAQFALVAALTESGQLDDAWRACGVLEQAVEADVPAQSAGNAHWVIGNVAFRRADLAQGVAHHERAAGLLRPASDIELWTRFNKASAGARLTAGMLEPSTLACIERAELAQSVIGARGTEALELALIRARWEYLNGEATRALELIEPLMGEAASLPLPLRGELEFLLARCLQATGRAQEALDHLELALGHFTEAGATDRAALARELVLLVRASR